MYPANQMPAVPTAVRTSKLDMPSRASSAQVPEVCRRTRSRVSQGHTRWRDWPAQGAYIARKMNRRAVRAAESEVDQNQPEGSAFAHLPGPSSTLECRHRSLPWRSPEALALHSLIFTAPAEKCSAAWDNFLILSGLYLRETTPLSLHFGELRLPVFLLLAAPVKPAEARFWAAKDVHAALLLLPSSFFKTRIPLSTCFSWSKNGGKKRRTVSCVLLNKTPSAKPASTTGRAGISN